MIDLHLSRKLFNDCYYDMLFDYSNPIEGYYGGAGSGKSYFIAQKLIIKAFRDKRKILVLRKTGTSQKESCWRLIETILRQWQIYDKCQVRISDMTITLPNGSVFLFKGMKDDADRERIKSITDISDAWLEEASEFDETDLTAVVLRVRAKKDNLQIFCSWNPVSKANWTYKRWICEPVKEKIYLKKTTYRDNLRFLPQSYIDALEDLINTNPTYYAIYNKGEYVSLDKLIYTNWEEREIDLDELKELPLVCGLDFGFTNDPSAFIASLIDEKNKNIYIFKEWYKTGQTNQDIAQAIKYMGFAKSKIIFDAAEPKSGVELRKEGLTNLKASVKGKDSVLHGIQLLQTYHIYVDPSCVNTITELSNYSWKKRDNEYVNEPEQNGFDHLMDALRYSIQGIGKKVKTFKKSALGV